MDFQKSTALIIAVTIFTAGMVLSSFKVANSFVEVKGGNAITVTGSAKKQIKSDLIVWQGTFSREAVNASEAYSMLKADKEVVLNYLDANGIKADQRTVSSVQSYPIYELNYNGISTNKILSYRLSQTVEIRSSKVDEVTQLSRDITDLIQKGIE